MKGQGGRTIQSTPRGPVRKTWQTSETIPLATRSLLRGSFVSTCQRTPLFQPKKRCKDNTKKVSQILYLCRRGAYKNIGRRGIKLLDEGIKRGIKQETSRQKKSWQQITNPLPTPIILLAKHLTLSPSLRLHFSGFP